MAPGGHPRRRRAKKEMGKDDFFPGRYAIRAARPMESCLKDFIRVRMGIQTGLTTLGERRDEWVEKAHKAHGLELTTVELVEYIACYCLLGEMSFDVTTGNFAKAVEEESQAPSHGINEVLKKLKQLEKRLEEIRVGKGDGQKNTPSK